MCIYHSARGFWTLGHECPSDGKSPPSFLQASTSNRSASAHRVFLVLHINGCIMCALLSKYEVHTCTVRLHRSASQKHTVFGQFVRTGAVGNATVPTLRGFVQGAV